MQLLPLPVPVTLQAFSLRQEFLGNPIASWTTAALIAAAMTIALLVIRRLLVSRLEKFVLRTATEIDDVAVELLRKTRVYFIVAVALRAGSLALELDSNSSIVVRKATSIAILLQLAVWGNTLVAFWLRKWSTQRDGHSSSTMTIRAIGLMARSLLWSIVALLVLHDVLDYDVTALVTGLGIGGVAIALAIQNVLADLFAALAIVLDKPFDVGDSIAVDSMAGVVEHVGLKTTRIRALGGEQVIFSNADLLKSRVRNLKRMTERRILFTIGVTYDTPPDKVALIAGKIRAIIEANPNTRFDRSHFARLGDSALEFEVVYFVLRPDYALYMDTQQSINLQLLQQFAADGIEFAYPSQTIHVKPWSGLSAVGSVTTNMSPQT